MKRAIVYFAALPLLAFSSFAAAITCDDITLSDEITSQYPDAQGACLGVVERDGQNFVKMKVRLTRNPISHHISFRILDADGNPGPNHSVIVASDWRANIGGREYTTNDLTRGQELSLYLPSNRWEAHVAAPEAEPPMELMFVAIRVASMPEDTASLPATSSIMPLFGLLGGAAFLGAGLIRVFRRK